jgi:transposase
VWSPTWSCRLRTTCGSRRYGFRPDFCEAGDPESKGIVEHLVGYAKRDLVVPEEPLVADLAAANTAAATWCAEVNGGLHS